VSLRPLLSAYLLGVTVLTAGFYAFPGWHMVLWSAIGVLSAAAMAFGVRRNRPRRYLPWCLLAAGTLTFAAGDTTYNLLTTVLRQQDAFPSVADVFYLVTCVLQNVGMILLARAMTAGRERTNVVDSVILTLGIGVLYWIFLINPYVQDPQLGLLAKAISVAYPLSDVLLLSSVARVVSARRTPAVTLLALGSAGLLISDVVYGLGQLNGSWQIGGPIDLGWIVLYASWGLAALHPSMAELTVPRVTRQAEVGPVRLTLLALSALVAPAVLLVEALRGAVRDGVVIAVVSAMMFALVLTRLGGVMNRHRQALARERSLREAASALLIATDVAGVAAAVRTAVAELLPPGVPHRVLFGAGEDPSAHGFPFALSYPLGITEYPKTGPRMDSLVVAADAPELGGLHWSVEALAAEAALALERIALADEINRRAGEEYFRTLVQNTPDLVMIVDDANLIRYASPSAAAVFGTETLIGVNLAELVEPGDRLVAVQLLDLVRSGGGRDETVDWRLPASDGRVLRVEVTCRDLRADPTVSGLVVTLRDVTERRRLERELTLRAFRDPLTGLANRVLFQERAGQAVARSHRTGQGAGLLLIDLDDFKEVNDTLGHAAGDELLVAVGERLAAILGPEHSPARLGGDEFAALIEDVTDPAELERLAEQVLSALAEPVRIGTHQVSGRASIGVAMVVEARDGEDLIRQADLALYAAKGAGKGQWRRYESELQAAVVARLRLRAELERAVERDEFTLHYQPIVALAGGATAGFEALVRWNHPEHGLLSPAHFISAAEDTGLIVPMGAFVLRSAVATAAEWYRRCVVAGVEPPYVSVNVSARQFRTPGFVDSVHQELSVAGLPPRYLMLEITESLLLRDDEQVWSDLAELRATGVRVAIDDFGTGYSSLSYLRQVPIDVLKIDKSFIDTASSAPRQRALVDGIIRLADNLGLAVVAEGIERDEDRDLLVNLGCRYGQGFLFARPLSYADAVTWLFTDRVAAA
jgi:diguanylate cyclase (GGDEF)-like protein/PAS domain S-box-containing protein